MRTRGTVLVLIFITGLLAAAGGLGWWRLRPMDTASSEAIRLSGTIEVETIAIASQLGGRILELPVDKGDRVRAGDVLVRLETTMLDVDLARTEAAVQALEAARDAAYEAWQAMRRAQEASQITRDELTAIRDRLSQLRAQAAQLPAGDARRQTLEATLDGLQEVVALLASAQAAPLVLDAQASQAEMFYRGMESLLQTALSIQDLLRIQRGRMTLRAPREGYIVDRLLAEGEIAAPLAPILMLADLSQVTLTVYVPEPFYGRIRLGDPVTVTVTGLPDQTFTGSVAYLSPRAEFTPAGVQTPDERARLVYAVEIRLDNPELALKPGMIADVWIAAQEGSDDVR